MAEVSSTLCLILAVLTASTGDGHFQRRYAASAALAQLAPLSLAHVALASKSRDTERSKRASLIMRSYRRANAERLAKQARWRTKYGNVPWIELDCDETYRYVHVAVSCGAKNAGPEWAAYRVATVLWIADQYRAGWDWPHISKRLRIMAEAERVWIIQNGAQYGLKAK